MLSLRASVRRASTAHDYRTGTPDASTYSLGSVHDTRAAAPLLAVHLVTAAAVVHLTAGRALLVALAGVGAGIVNGVAGGGTLLRIPMLARGFQGRAK